VSAPASIRAPRCERPSTLPPGGHAEVVVVLGQVATREESAAR
jgi:hypothetical protein